MEKIEVKFKKTHRTHIPEPFLVTPVTNGLHLQWDEHTWFVVRAYNRYNATLIVLPVRYPGDTDCLVTQEAWQIVRGRGVDHLLDQACKAAAKLIGPTLTRGSRKLIAQRLLQLF